MFNKEAAERLKMLHNSSDDSESNLVPHRKMSQVNMYGCVTEKGDFSGMEIIWQVETLRSSTTQTCSVLKRNAFSLPGLTLWVGGCELYKDDLRWPLRQTG